MADAGSKVGAARAFSCAAGMAATNMYIAGVAPCWSLQWIPAMRPGEARHEVAVAGCCGVAVLPVAPSWLGDSATPTLEGVAQRPQQSGGGWPSIQSPRQYGQRPALVRTSAAHWACRHQRRFH
eukprot:scaffold3600_cov387-Prasinococcus_capsulatus_cf.AAC.4